MAKRSARAGKRWDPISGRWRWVESGAFAPAPKKAPPKKAPKKLSDAPKKAPPKKRREAPKKAPPKKRREAPKKAPPKKRAPSSDADIRALCIAVFGRRRLEGEIIETMGDVVGAISRETGGTRVDADDWRSRLEFATPKTTGELARELGDVDWNALDFRGTRVHLGALTTARVFLPITLAFGEPTDLGVMAVAELLKDVARYRSRSEEGTSAETLDDEVGEATPLVTIGAPTKKRTKKGAKKDAKNRGSSRKRTSRKRR